MKNFIVVATFKDGVTQDEIRALIPEEQARAKVLKEAGSIGFIQVAMPRRTVFLEAFAESEESAIEIIHSLPFIKIWNIEIFETTPPAGAQV
jgi:hypothetical protein